MERLDSLVRPEVSLIIPVYNEERRLHTLPRIAEFMGMQDFSWEVLVVDDGSEDRTPELVGEFLQHHSGFSFQRAPHRGKGHAVRTGMLAAKGRICFFSDLDLSVPIEDMPRFFPALEEAPVAIGSREAPGAVRYNEPGYRHLLGRVYNLLVRMILLPGVQDTQCGFKAFHHDAAIELFSRQQIDDWGFDIEVLYLARRLGYDIVEVPVHWTYAEHSRVRALRDSWRMFRDIWRVRWRARSGEYQLR